MSNFTLEFFPDASPETFSAHSAGVADLITTSFGGRNRKCAEAFVKTGKSFEELEEELLEYVRVAPSSPSLLPGSIADHVGFDLKQRPEAPGHHHHERDLRVPRGPRSRRRLPAL